MLMSINHFAIAQYQLDGTVDLTSIPKTDLVYHQTNANVSATAGQIVYYVRLRYHNELESTDPYYSITAFHSHSDFTVSVKAGSYHFIYSNDQGLNDDMTVVAVTKDLEILCSLPEPDFQSGTDSGVIKAGCDYDYDTWRINTAYMPHLVPAG